MNAREKAKDAAEGFAARLKAARRRAGLTQEGLGNLADFAPVTLSKLETGVNKPTFEIFVALAHALQVSPNYLAGWDGANPDGGSGIEHRLLLNRLMLAGSRMPVDWLDLLVALAEKAPKAE